MKRRSLERRPLLFAIGRSREDVGVRRKASVCGLPYVGLG
jgi:hypothetical protein